MVRGSGQYSAFNRQTVSSCLLLVKYLGPHLCLAGPRSCPLVYSHQIINLQKSTGAEKGALPRGREPERSEKSLFTCFSLFQQSSSQLQRPLVLPAPEPQIISLFSPLQLWAQLSQTSLVNYHGFPASKMMLWFLLLLFLFFPSIFFLITLCGFSEVLRGSAICCIYAIHHL